MQTRNVIYIYKFRLMPTVWANVIGMPDRIVHANDDDGDVDTIVNDVLIHFYLCGLFVAWYLCVHQ